MHWLSLNLIAFALMLEAVFRRPADADGWPALRRSARSLSLACNLAGAALLVTAPDGSVLIPAAAAALTAVLQATAPPSPAPALRYNEARHDRLAGDRTRPEHRAHH